MFTQTSSEQYLDITRRWFTEGWAGNLALAGDLFSETLRTNGVHVGVGGTETQDTRATGELP